MNFIFKDYILNENVYEINKLILSKLYACLLQDKFDLKVHRSLTSH